MHHFTVITTVLMRQLNEYHDTSHFHHIDNIECIGVINSQAIIHFDITDYANISHIISRQLDYCADIIDAELAASMAAATCFLSAGQLSVISFLRFLHAIGRRYEGSIDTPLTHCRGHSWRPQY